MQKTFVLVHGASHGAWCWYKVAARLREAGHVVVTPDLPGHGIDRTSLADVTFASYVAAITRIVQEQKDTVVLVGHSMGGAVISQVAEEIPQKISALVYLAAPLLMSQESMLQAMNGVQPTMQSVAMVDVERGILTIKREHAASLFYNDCSEADIALAQILLTPQALSPLSTPVQLSERYEGVRRVYVETLQDHTVAIEAQRQMRAKTPCDRIFTLNTSHSPFFLLPITWSNAF